jgi:hypothetical protein
LRDLWRMDVHVFNEIGEIDEDFDDEFFCVIDINLYVYIHHDLCKNAKVYYTALNYFRLDDIF